MGFFDAALAIVIVGGAVYLVYRSIWKNKGRCPDCKEDHKIKTKVWKDD